ncbi:MAG: DUF389 domain-containing protein [Methylomonas sp.]|uniref:DUF389 domain-containing protein n=1 Tax=Methylomonas sp. TaxID=418 RepID=UPI0025D6361C|nr:DUF389 domain-containing protein [Methylomonas sp.]MCK9604998.1 DUF389 domain-containing protein [Methylomonas sp.]
MEIQVARTEIARNAQFDKAFIIMNALAAIIASYALLADSSSGVIGAMLVAMLLSPIAGVSLALVDGDSLLFRQSLLSLGGGIGIVVLCALVVGLIHTEIPAGKELLGRTHPNYLDLMIALAGGAVGAYAVISPRIVNAVVGVAIATALVPPLCTGTIFAARGEWDNAGGAYLLAFANIVAIQFSSSIVLWLAGFHQSLDRFYRNKKVVWLNAVSFLLIGLLFTALGANTKMVITQILYETNVRKALRQEIKRYPGAYMSEARINQEDGKNLVRIVVRSPHAFSAKQVGGIESKLPPPPNTLPTELRLRHIMVEVMTKEGSKFDIKMSEVAPEIQEIESAEPP